MKLLLIFVALIAVGVAVYFVLQSRKSAKDKSEHANLTDQKITPASTEINSQPTQSASALQNPEITASEQISATTAAEAITAVENLTSASSEVAETTEANPSELLLEPETVSAEPVADTFEYLEVEVTEGMLASSTESPQSAQETASKIEAIDTEAHIPEDSTLKRHYLSNREAEKLAITNPYPSDSTLKRHYDSKVAALL